MRLGQSQTAPHTLWLGLGTTTARLPPTMEMPGSRLLALVEVWLPGALVAGATCTATDRTCTWHSAGGGNALNRMLETGLQVRARV